jgi:hypothetical protein
MKYLIRNARLSFPDIFKARAMNESDEPSFSASFLLPANDPQVAEIDAILEKMAKEKWKDKASAIMGMMRKQDRLCLHDGNFKPYAGYEGTMYVSSRSKSRPTVFDRKREPVTAESGVIYSGCYVNGSVEFWCQDHQKHGKRINAQLRGVQFVKDSDAFSAGTPASEDEFDDLGDQGDEIDPTK